jgi:hypothetical protein
VASNVTFLDRRAKIPSMPAGDATARSQLPWWREPFAIGFFALILVASGAVLLKGMYAPPRPVDASKPQPVPGGGSFCDPALPVQSTAYNPSTQVVK